MIGRAGRPKGSTKAACAAAEGQAAAVPPLAAVEERVAAAVLPAAASDAGGASGAGAPSGRRPPISWLTAAPAGGAGAQYGSGSYGTFSSAGAGIGRGLDASGNDVLRPASPAALLGGRSPMPPPRRRLERATGAAWVRQPRLHLTSQWEGVRTPFLPLETFLQPLFSLHGQAISPAASGAPAPISAISVDTPTSDRTPSLSAEDLIAGSFNEATGVSPCTDTTLLAKFLLLYWLRSVLCGGGAPLSAT